MFELYLNEDNINKTTVLIAKMLLKSTDYSKVISQSMLKLNISIILLRIK